MCNKTTRGTILHILDFKPRCNRPLDHFLLRIAERTEILGYNTRFIFSQTPDVWFTDRLPKSASFTEFSCPPYYAFKDILSEVRRLRPAFTTLSFVPLFTWRTYALRLFSPLIWIDHTSEDFLSFPGLKRLVAKLRGTLISKLIYKAVSVSDFNRDRNIDKYFLDPKKTIRIYNGCVLNQGSGDVLEVPNSRYFFFCGMLKKDKGVHTLIKAFDLFCTRETAHEDIEFWLAGKEFGDKAILDALDSCKCAHRIKFLGHRSDIHHLMAHSLAIAVPSEWPEAFGFTAVEAMYSERPLIHSNAGALPEVVGDCGLCFEKGNEEQLADKLSQIIHQPESSIKTMTQRARKKVETDYTIERMVEDYMTVFKAALSSRSGKSKL